MSRVRGGIHSRLARIGAGLALIGTSLLAGVGGAHAADPSTMVGEEFVADNNGVLPPNHRSFITTSFACNANGESHLSFVADGVASGINNAPPPTPGDYVESGTI